VSRINLLPHREIRRERIRKAFYGQAIVAGLFGVFAAIVVAIVIDTRVEAQQARNRFIQKENEKLDAEIAEIALLRLEIEDLKARKTGVEELQRERTLPVHVLDDLVTYLPDGIYFRQIKQQERRVSLVGIAQSNDRVSNLLRRLSSDTRWVERPELVEIKALKPGKADGRDARPDSRTVFEFSVNARMKALQQPAPAVRIGAAGATASPAPPAQSAPAPAPAAAPAAASQPGPAAAGAKAAR
jgi:type IV pilus assembly protein PilN